MNLSMTNAAKKLRSGRTRLFQFLREENIMCSDSALPREGYIAKGWFVYSAKKQKMSEGFTRVFPCVHITEKGFEEIDKIYPEHLRN